MDNIIIDNAVERYVPELENRDMLFISYDSDVPKNYSGISIKISFDEKVEPIFNKSYELYKAEAKAVRQANKNKEEQTSC